MAYTSDQIQAFRDELTALQAARTKLLTGRMAVKAVIDGDVVEYHRIDLPYLNQRIGEIENILASIDSTSDHAVAFRVNASKGL